MDNGAHQNLQIKTEEILNMKRTIEAWLLCAMFLSFTVSAYDKDAAIPIVSIGPVFPLKAALDGVNGQVVVDMTVNTSGSVDEAVVVSAEPAGVFDQYALAAAKKFKFKPKFVAGRAVQSVYRQTFGFQLDNPFGVALDSPLLAQLYDRFLQMKSGYGQVVIADSVKIKSKIKPKEVTQLDYFYHDDMMVLHAEPMFWPEQKTQDVLIEDLQAQLNHSVALVQAQYDKHPGVYKKFHRAIKAKNHPPVLLSTVDLDVSKYQKNITKKRYQLTLDSSGQIIAWKDLLDQEVNKKDWLRSWAEEELSQLKFLPAIKNHQAVKSKITIEYDLLGLDVFEVVRENLEQNSHHDSDNHWVKLAALLDPTGHVSAVQVVASSDPSYEAKAVLSLQHQQFETAKQPRQMLELIEFVAD